ncbi:SDR family NAD(P)-dependent oxidoreductase [Amycolatopsis sp. QT-25]|uniref:SDR family NAD(P)-dependent oxidoreductase n=1 Tax=Amycolatopsis sp. QT-25 TaxID=3034022 RepID=UPI0023EAC90F|nr:SDR family NAD(P)-dependent oxidoreductase [Amycolatopsis sp. QT-25]WET79284.1 SDR family NAD(P)-dependent oxidoreductase [Amycolatopsis sp. QT-25]
MTAIEGAVVLATGGQRGLGKALVNVHSVLSWAAGSGAYGASKAAFWSLTNSLRIEFAQRGTHVVGVHLGYTDTDPTQGLDVPKNDPRDVARQVVDGLERARPKCSPTTSRAGSRPASSGPVEHLGTSRIAA